MGRRELASEAMRTKYGSLFGSLLHAVKYRPEIAAIMSLLGSCLTFPNEDMYQALMRVTLVYLGRSPKVGITFSRHQALRLRCFADSNWSVTRSTTGYCMLCGGVVSPNSHRQHCITMSSTEAELVALADCAIELRVCARPLARSRHRIPRAH